jgi:hypothetical protein
VLKPLAARSNLIHGIRKRKTVFLFIEKIEYDGKSIKDADRSTVWDLLRDASIAGALCCPLGLGFLG